MGLDIDLLRSVYVLTEVKLDNTHAHAPQTPHWNVGLLPDSSSIVFDIRG